AGAWRSMRPRAVVWRGSWLWVRERSIADSVPLPRRFARGPADADPPRHLHALDVGRAAGVDGDDAVTLLQLEEAVGGAPDWIRGERGGADRVQERGRHSTPPPLPVGGKPLAFLGVLV